MKTKLIDINGIEIFTLDTLAVLDANNKFCGWGWFEFNSEDGFWFREDYHEAFPQGMDSEIIQNITDYKFEIFK